MNAVLVDTDVFSYFLKDDTRAALYRGLVEGKTPCVSFVTIGELYSWAILREWGKKKTATLSDRLRSVVVIPFDFPLCMEYAKLCRIKTLDGGTQSIPANDRWIAACALRHGIPLVTGNVRHFRAVPGLDILEPAPSSPSDVRLPL